MTQAIELLEQLRSGGVSVSLDHDELVLRPGNKVPSGLLPDVLVHKAALIALLTESSSPETLLARLHKGHVWLLDQHQRWQSGDTTAANDAEFSRVWNGWWELDRQLRADYGFQGCIYGPDGVCPEDFPCQGCADLPTPGVVARLQLTGIVGT